MQWVGEKCRSKLSYFFFFKLIQWCASNSNSLGTSLIYSRCDSQVSTRLPIKHISRLYTRIKMSIIQNKVYSIILEPIFVKKDDVWHCVHNLVEEVEHFINWLVVFDVHARYKLDFFFLKRWDIWKGFLIMH